jgi:hypothetical protein
MSTAVSPNAGAVAKELAGALQGKLPQDKLDATLAALKAPATTYPCIATIICLIFYMRVAIAITGGKSFSGNAGGICLPPGGTGGGQVYTNDINKLYKDTVSFALVTAAAYLHVTFYDKDSNILGTAECGGAYTAGATGGTGSWS